MTHHILIISNILQSAIAEALTNVSSKLSSVFKEIGRQRARKHMINSTIKELQALTDKELIDIGITRGEIRDIAHRRNDLT